MWTFILILMLAPPLDGLRTMPDPAGGLWLRWEGSGRPVVDGAPVGPSPVHLSAGPHTVEGTEIPGTPDPCAPLRFIVLGDARAGVAGIGPGAYWPGMLGEALAQNPYFILNTGDIVKKGESPAEWPPYLRTLPIWPPVVAVRGNHDRGSSFKRLGIGPGGSVFVWRVGPVLLVGVDSEVPDADLPAMLARLDTALEADATWKIVALHRPIWSRGTHGSDDRGLNARLVPILDAHHVDLVFSGHDHDYERFCPLRGIGPDRQCVEPDEGVTYIVTGGGATFTVPFPGLSWHVSAENRAKDAQTSQVFSGSQHYVQVDVDRGRLTIRAVRTRTGNVRPPGIFDQIVRTHPDPPACQRRVDAGLKR